ncbi:MULTISPECIES: hypothetical protein [Hyphomicrobiales]|nr:MULTISPECIES: hypothetical protein [Hyphomicrobiales]
MLRTRWKRRNGEINRRIEFVGNLAARLSGSPAKPPTIRLANAILFEQEQ